MNHQLHGKAPYTVVVVHGGPGAAGEMAPVARELAALHGIIEPWQTAATLDGQVGELHAALEAQALLPVILIGHSWGAWLSLILTARFPAMVRKLILISSPPFEERDTAGIEAVRCSRLAESEADEFKAIAASGSPAPEAFQRLSELTKKSDSYDPVEETDTPIALRSDIFSVVWQEAAALRKNGELLRLAAAVYCPVFALHGDYDPHPADGVREPLSRVVRDFSFELLAPCGHTPWKERHARHAFYKSLKAELRW